MKQIVAIVKPFLAERVVASIADKPVEEISIREVKGYGRQKNYLDQYGENEYSLASIGVDTTENELRNECCVMKFHFDLDAPYDHRLFQKHRYNM